MRLRYQGWAKAAGVATLQRVETGAVTGVHRAGASLNVHVHLHLLCLDGVYVEDGDTLRFEPAPAPTRAELTSMLERIYARVMKWLVRHGLLRNPDDADASNATPERSSAEALTTAGMQRGIRSTWRDEPTVSWSTGTSRVSRGLAVRSPTGSTRWGSWTPGRNADLNVQQEVRNVARAVANTVRGLRAGTLVFPDAKLKRPRPK